MNVFLNNKKTSIYYKNKLIKIPQNSSIVSSFIYDENTIPQIFINHYESRQTTSNDVIIPFYFSDYYQREYAYNDSSLSFKLRYEIDGVVNYISDLKAGDNEVNLGKLSKGVHWYSLQIEDFGGRVSRRIFNDILIVDPDEYVITPEQIYTITIDDLNTYGIKNNNSQELEDMKNTRYGLTQLLKYIKEQGYRKAVLPFGTYRVNRTPVNAWEFTDPKDGCIKIPSELTLDLNNSIIKLHPYNDTEYGEVAKVGSLMIGMHDTFDSHLINIVHK